MMFSRGYIKNKFSIVLIAFLVLYGLEAAFLNMGTLAAVDSREKVLIVYEGKGINNEDLNNIMVLKEISEGFDKKVYSIKAEDYKKGYMKGFDYVLVYGLNDDLKTIFYDLSDFTKPVCWIGCGIEKFIPYLKDCHISFMGYKDDLIKLNYDGKGGREFFIPKLNQVPCVNANSANFNAALSLSDGRNSYPYSLHENNFWYASCMGCSGALYYSIFGVMDNIYEKGEPSKGKLYLKIENVSPLGDKKKLTQIADYLHDEGIPYIIVLMPVYFNTDLPEMHEFMKVVKHMEDNGGAVVLHSFLQQSYSQSTPTSGLLDTEKASVYERFKKTMKVYTENGIYPIGFEAPWDIIRLSDYNEIRKDFTTFIPQYVSYDKASMSSIDSTDDFRKIISDRMDDLKKEDFNMMSLIDGYNASISIDADTDIDKLKKSISQLRDYDVEFSDLLDEDSDVKFEDIDIKCSNGRVQFNGGQAEAGKKDTKSKENTLDSKEYKGVSINKNISGINRFMILAVSISCILFLIIFINGKMIDRRKFLR